MASNAKAKRGRSKQKRSDFPLVTLGLVLDDSGFVCRSKMFEGNIVWLVEHQYRYLVVSRERNRQFDETEAIATTTASQQTIQIQRVPNEDGAEVCLYCHSEARQDKEVAMTTQFAERFEAGLVCDRRYQYNSGSPQHSSNAMVARSMYAKQRWQNQNCRNFMLYWGYHHHLEEYRNLSFYVDKQKCSARRCFFDVELVDIA